MIEVQKLISTFGKLLKQRRPGGKGGICRSAGYFWEHQALVTGIIFL